MTNPAKNEPFRFQQFAIADDGAAMKIGTDAVLLGSWTPLRQAKTILDIGTGCGIVALMLAQRSVSFASQISAIDIDQGAAQQALANFQESPWPNRLPVCAAEIHQSLQQFVDQDQSQGFDLIVCNPPFFEPNFAAVDPSRAKARSTQTLTRASLLSCAKSFFDDLGRLSIIIPYDQAAATIADAEVSGYHLWSRTDVRPTPISSLKRSLLEFGLSASNSDELTHGELIVETLRHVYSDNYRELTQNFHLRYAK